MALVAMKVTSNYVGAEGHRMKGDLIRVDTERARELIRIGVAAVVTGPAETKPARAQETKGAEESMAKKPSDSPTDGRSTDTALSGESGQGERSSASAGGRASRKRRSTRAITRDSLPLR